MKAIAVIALFILTCCSCWSQTFNKTFWHFGETPYGLHFDTTGNPPVVTNNSYTPYTNEGCSVLNDPNTGELLFYTDGLKVVDANGDVMPNGAGLLGHISCFGSGKLAVDPSDCNRFYIFHNNADMSFNIQGTVRYSVVDMNLPGNGSFATPLGDIVTTEKNISIASDKSEAMEIVPRAGTRDYWLLLSDNEDEQINVYELNENGVIFSATYNIIADLSDMRGFKISPQFDKGAITSLIENQETILFDFDATTGIITNQEILEGTPLGSNAGWYGVFDMEWSSDGSKLYLSKYRTASPASGGRLLQYDLNSPNDAPTLIHQISNSTSNLGRGLRRGPDNKIYWIYHNPTTNSTQHIGCVNEPNQSDGLCDFEPIGIDMGATLGGVHLFPTFLEFLNTIAPPQDIPISLTAACTDSIAGSVSIQQYLSDAEGDSLIIQSVDSDCGTAYIEGDELFYSLPLGFAGTCNIQVNYCDDYCFPLCSALQFVIEVEVIQSDANPIADEVIDCSFTSVTVGYQAEGFEYLWNTGDSTAFITVTTPGEYTYYATDANGCVMADTVDVLLGQLSADLIVTADTTACEGETIQLIANTPASNIFWSTDETTSSINVNQSGQYWAMAYDFEGCEAMDTVDVNFAPLPEAAITVNATTCSTKLLYSGSDGTLLWSNGADSPSIALTESGEYWVMVVDEQGCSDTAFTDVQLLPPPEVVIVQSNTPCQTVLTASGAEGDIYWSTGANTNSIVITQSGPYSVEITLDDGCGFSASVEAVIQLLDTLVIHQDISLCRHLLYVDENNATLEWSNGSTDDSLEVYSSAAYTLTQTYANDCVVTSTIYADVSLPQLPQYILPNVFTPNSDGDNDAFQTFPDALTCVSEFEMTVFNRWGNELYHTTDKNFQWGATSGNGGLVSDGVYYCTVRFVHQMRLHEFDWHVQVLR